MELVNVKDLTITTDAQFRESNPTVMFGQIIDKATYLAYGYAPVLRSPPPEAAKGYVTVRDGVKLDGLGNYVEDWKVIAKPLDQLEAEHNISITAINAAIKAERDRRKFNGVRVMGVWVHTDVYSRTQWMAMVMKSMLGQNVAGVTWKTMDGSYITTTAELAKAVFAAVENLDISLFAWATELSNKVAGSANPHAVDITVGWPLTFGE